MVLIWLFWLWSPFSCFCGLMELPLRPNFIVGSSWNFLNLSRNKFFVEYHYYCFFELSIHFFIDSSFQQIFFEHILCLKSRSSYWLNFIWTGILFYLPEKAQHIPRICLQCRKCGRTCVQSLGQEHSLGGMATHSRRGDRGRDGWMASPTLWTWVWVSSGSWWWTGKPGVLQSIGLQRAGHDWATELTDICRFSVSTV